MEGGWFDYKIKPSDHGREMIIHGHVVRRDEIPSYFTRKNIDYINLFWTYKTMGLPFAGGWAEQPAYIIDIITLLEGELGKRQKKNG